MGLRASVGTLRLYLPFPCTIYRIGGQAAYFGCIYVLQYIAEGMPQGTFPNSIVCRFHMTCQENSSFFCNSFDKFRSESVGHPFRGYSDPTALLPNLPKQTQKQKEI